MIFQIIRHWQDNRRHVYAEMSDEFYDHEYYTKSCAGYEAFKVSRGAELNGVAEKLLSLFPLSGCATVLDMGCGRGEIVRALSERGVRHVTGIDTSSAGLALARETCAAAIQAGRVTIDLMSVCETKYESASFDAVVMADIVEHLTDANLRLAVAEAHRVLKPGGRLIVHTMPCVNFKLVGQYVVKAALRLKGTEWWTPTSKQEAGITHINIQSVASLREYLETSFDRRQIKVASAPSRNEGLLKRGIGALGLWSILSPHLWATAKK